MVNDLLIWGIGNKARLICAMVDSDFSKNTRVRALYSPETTGDTVEQAYRIISDPEELLNDIPNFSHFFVGFAGVHGFARWRTHETLLALGLQPLSVISPRSIIDQTCKLGLGVNVMPGAVVNNFATLCSQVIVNTNATVEHDCIISDGAHIMVGACLGGNVTVGKYASVGTNATILPGVEIGEHAIVGAGAVVLSDVPPKTVVVGNPARFLREHEPDCDEHQFNLLTDKQSK